MKKTENRINRKQKGDKVMKTKNNVQKAVKKTLAVGISLILISITVSAQDFWKSLFEKSSLNTIASAMVDKNSKTVKTERKISFNADYVFKAETEKPLELENWMISESTFNLNLTIEDEVEPPLELEEWMTNESNFENSTFEIIEEKDEPLNLENWMIKESTFNVNLTIEDEVEPPLKLEEWMLKDKLFETNENQEQPLKLESWMTSENIWIS